MSSEAPEELLRVFFGTSNDLSYEDAVTSARFDELTPWIEDLRSGRFPVMLPRVRDGFTTWYGLADSSLGLRELRELLGAFVGPTYTSFRGGSLPLNPQDPIEAVVNRVSGGRVVKFEAWPRGDTEHQKAVRDRLLMMRSLRMRAPPRTREPARPTWRVLRDIELALADRAHDAAESYLEELSTGHALGEPNLTFLHVRLAAEAGRWEEILKFEQLPWLLHVVRPPRVTAAIITAIYHAIVSPALEADRDLGDVAHEIESLYGPLVRADPRPLTAATATVVLLTAAHAQPRREDQLKRILERVQGQAVDVDARLLDAMPRPEAVDSQEPTESDDPLTEAEAALEAGDHERALDVARHAEPSERQIWVLIRTAATVQSLSSAQAVLEVLDQLPEEERRVIEHSPVTGPTVHGLRELSSETGVPDGWIKWAEMLTGLTRLRSPREVAERGAAEWDRSLSDSDLQTLGDMLARAPDHSVPGIVRSLPHLLSAFPIEDARPAHLALYLALLQRLAVEGQVSSQDLASSLSLMDGILRIGPSIQEHEDLVEMCQMLWDAAASLSAIDWLIDVMQILAHHPCPAPDRRRSFVVTALSRLSQWPSSLDRAALAGLATVGEVVDLDVAQLLPPLPHDGEEERTSDPWALLAGRRLGIYTLTESASSRATEVIRRLAPTVQVDTNHDHVCTEQLASLSRNVDLMVVVTQSATHAATDCIDAHRGPGPTVRPAGKGYSSIIRAIEHELRTAVLTAKW